MSEMHANDEELQRLIHGELDPQVAQRLSAHLATCPRCSDRFDEARREEQRVFELLRRIDHKVPASAFENIAAVKSRVRIPRMAAAILIGIVLAGGAYALPGSPLPGVIRRIFDKGPGAPTQWRDSLSPVPAAAAGADYSGQDFAPGKSFTISFTGRAAGSVIVVSLVDSANVAVRFAPPAAATLDNPDSTGVTVSVRTVLAEYRVQIPRSAPHVAILIAGRQVFVKRGASVSGGTLDSAGRYLLSLAPPG